MDAHHEATYVFVERIAPNAAMLHPHPQENASTVAQMLVERGWAASMVGPEKPLRGGVLFFDGSEFDDAVLGDIATTLNSQGVGCYAHELVDSVDDDGQPTLVFHRSGTFPTSGNRVLLTHSYLFDDMATTWLFGAPTDLEAACQILRVEVDDVRVMPVYTLGSVDDNAPPLPEAVEVRHVAPIFSDEEAADIASPLVDALTMAGFSGPIIMTDHRVDPDGEQGRLEASY